MTDVVMPQMGESIVEGTLTKWLKKTGERWSAMSRCSKFRRIRWIPRFPSPAAGVLAEMLVQEGQTVR